MKKLSYKEKFIQMNKEAKATWLIAAILIAFWWITGFGTANMDYTILAMPGWFMTSCFGTYILSVILVWIIVKKVFVDFDLEDDETETIEKTAEEKKEVM